MLEIKLSYLILSYLIYIYIYAIYKTSNSFLPKISIIMTIYESNFLNDCAIMYRPKYQYHITYSLLITIMHSSRYSSLLKIEERRQFSIQFSIQVFNCSYNATINNYTILISYEVQM